MEPAMHKEVAWGAPRFRRTTKEIFSRGNNPRGRKTQNNPVRTSTPSKHRMLVDCCCGKRKTGNILDESMAGSQNHEQEQITLQELVLCLILTTTVWLQFLLQPFFIMFKPNGSWMYTHSPGKIPSAFGNETDCEYKEHFSHMFDVYPSCRASQRKFTGGKSRWTGPSACLSGKGRKTTSSLDSQYRSCPPR